LGKPIKTKKFGKVFFGSLKNFFGGGGFCLLRVLGGGWDQGFKEISRKLTKKGGNGISISGSKLSNCFRVPQR
jgi:hypothetical protein